MSAAAGRRQSVVGMRRTSVDPGPTRTLTTLTSAQTQREVKQWENTYQLQPDVSVSSSKLKKILENVLTSQLEKRTYNPESARMAKDLADQIKKRCKELGMARYKFVCLVSMGPSHQCTVSLASRCVWNPAVDTYAEHTFRNSHLYATAVVYGIYTE